jgi:hypothetical protein
MSSTMSPKDSERGIAADMSNLSERILARGGIFTRLPIGLYLIIRCKLLWIGSSREDSIT